MHHAYKHLEANYNTPNSKATIFYKIMRTPDVAVDDECFNTMVYHIK